MIQHPTSNKIQHFAARALSFLPNISISAALNLYPKGKTIINIRLPAKFTMFVLLVYFIIHGCVATTTNTTNSEDLSQFSRGPELCPGLIGEWPQWLVPISCDDPECRGMSSALPPYRCRQHGGVMFGREVFGCRCCPRVIDCDDPNCDSGNSEICQSELLADCLCVSSERRVPVPPTSAPFDIATAGQFEDTLMDLNLDESLNNDINLVTPSGSNCPHQPPVKCLDPQCRGLDDWKTETEMFTTPRCNRVDGKLVTNGLETALHGCPCCPEHINCGSADCNGGAYQACTTAPLYGCFCDWPNPGASLLYWQPPWQPGDPPDIYVNDFDASFNNPNFHPSAGQSLPTTVSFIASSSILSEARPLATHESSTAPAILQNLTRMDLLLDRQEAFGLSQNSSVLIIPAHFKNT